MILHNGGHVFHVLVAYARLSCTLMGSSATSVVRQFLLHAGRSNSNIGSSRSTYTYR